MFVARAVAKCVVVMRVCCTGSPTAPSRATCAGAAAQQLPAAAPPLHDRANSPATALGLGVGQTASLAVPMSHRLPVWPPAAPAAAPRNSAPLLEKVAAVVGRGAPASLRFAAPASTLQCASGAVIRYTPGKAVVDTKLTAKRAALVPSCPISLLACAIKEGAGWSCEAAAARANRAQYFARLHSAVVARHAPQLFRAGRRGENSGGGT
jgi:hypothetical protein